MAVPLILRNYFTGESSGGTFTLTGLTQYPNTIFISGGTGNVTFNSAADLPYTIPTGYVASVTVSTPGIYTFDYCVSGCTTECSTVNITVIEKPIIGTSPTIYRCGVNGVYNNINVCYSGDLVNNSNGLPYSGTLSSFTWSKGAWSATGNCVTIPTSVSAGAITLTATTTGGTCVSTNTVNLVDVNIYAGNTATKNWCLDKHQVEIYKNTPIGSNTNIVVDLNTIFTGTGEIIPIGALTTWSFISGPTTVTMTSNTSADMGNAPTGTYVFKRKVTYGSCVSETTYTMVLKYCTRGDQVITNKTSCKLNVTLNMATTFASTINPLYNPITTGGCFYYLGLLGGASLDIEINGTLFTNFPLLGCIPYNANVKISSVGFYDFEYTSTSNLSGCTSCTPVDDLTLCGCDYFSTFNGVGTFVIDTTGSIPNAGATKIHNLSCGSRQVSLFSKFNQLNGGNITAGGVWTYQGLAAPITFLVNGTSMTFNIGDTIPGADPLVDLTGLPNPSNYIFKYTVTNACGTANKNLIVNITCNDCNKTIDTTYTKTDCITNLTLVRPTVFTPMVGNLLTETNNSYVRMSVLGRLTDCNGVTTDQTFYSRVASLNKYSVSTHTMGPGDYLKTVTLFSSTLGYKTLNIDPNTTPYLTSSCPSTCSTTVTASSLYLPTTISGLSLWANNITKVIKNAICVEFGANCNNFTLVVTAGTQFADINQTSVQITTGGRHSPTSQWICQTDNTCIFTFSDAGVTKNSGNLATGIWGGNIAGNAYMGDLCGNYYAQYTAPIDPTAHGYLDWTISTMFNYVLTTASLPLTIDNTYNNILSNTCKKWNFSTTITPACSGTPTYSYKVGGVSIPDTTATFNRRTSLTECNPFNSGLSESLETTVVCDGCTYVKTPLTFC